MPTPTIPHSEIWANEASHAIGHIGGIQWVIWRNDVTHAALDIIDREVPTLEGPFATTLGSLTIVLPGVAVPKSDVMARIRKSTENSQGAPMPAGLAVVLEGSGLWRSTWRLIGRTATSLLKARMPVHFADTIRAACDWHGNNLLDAGADAMSGHQIYAHLESAGIEAPAG